jgi:hypothetical protein
MNQQIQYCPNCRAPLDPRKKFCSNCGMPVTNSPPQQNWGGQRYQGGNPYGYPKKKTLWGINIAYLIVFAVLLISVIVFAVIQLGPKPDTSGPQIYGAKITYISKTGCTIVWYTDEPASTQIEYGFTTNYGAIFPVNASDDVYAFKDINVGKLYHALTISSLQTGKQYHIRAISHNIKGYTSRSEDFTVKTKAANDPFINDE